VESLIGKNRVRKVSRIEEPYTPKPEYLNHLRKFTKGALE
jgi:hypothetical protein